MIQSDKKHEIEKVYEVFIGKKKFLHQFYIKTIYQIKKYFLGSYSVYFNVAQFENGKSITLETESYFLFLSSFSMSFHNKCNSAALEIRHHFNVKSMVFQHTIGIGLRMYFKQHLQQALSNLKALICKLQAERIYLNWRKYVY